MAKKVTSDQPLELAAIGAIYTALKDLQPDAQIRAVRYAAEMLGLQLSNSYTPSERQEPREPPRESQIDTAALPNTSSEDEEGINPVALRWLRRSGLDLSRLKGLFSLGIEEIDLVAENVPGKGKKERMRNVLLLKGIAGYLSSGTPRVSAEQLKEASLHYQAYDSTNHAKYISQLSADISGSKESGYTLSPRGLTAATQLIKEMAT